MKKNGILYFSFNGEALRIGSGAHRVFSISFLLELFVGKYDIDQFSFVDDHGKLHKDEPITGNNVKNNFGCEYGCGIFEMTKLGSINS